MATAAELPVNGNYPQQGYDATAYTAAATSAAPSYAGSQQNTQTPSAAAAEIPKDEVGWYFVEQYYTTLSRSPDRLYVSSSPCTSIATADVLSALLQQAFAVRLRQRGGQGQCLRWSKGALTANPMIRHCLTRSSQAINDRIKELDFHDTKVRVTNVDSQGSDANIVIQVIGEISNKGQPHKRFAQTFVLAEQTNGYFVLNDIFRYLAEEPEEEEELQQDASAAATGVQEPAPTAAAPENAQLNESDDIANTEDDLTKVDQKLEETRLEEPVSESAPAAAVNGTPDPEPAEVAEADEAPAAAVSAAEEASSKEPEAPVEEAATEEEKPKDPAPTPAAPKTATSATPAAPAKPAVPKSWAALAASAHKVATPVIPTAATPQTSSQSKAASSTPTQPLAVPTPAAASVPAREPSPANSQGDAAGWQTAGTKKEQSRGQAQASSEADQRRAYIKNVYSQVEEGALKAALSKFGEIEHLDISRQKV
jgi:hypothetical protein